METIFLQYILPFITLVFGGGFFWQLYTLKSYKRKTAYEADSSGIKNLSAIIAQMQQRLDKQQSEIERLTKLHNDNFLTIATLQKQILDEGNKCIECDYRKNYLSNEKKSD